MTKEILRMQYRCMQLRRLTEEEAYAEELKHWHLKKLKSEYNRLSEELQSTWIVLGLEPEDKPCAYLNNKINALYNEIKRRK